MSAKDMRAMVRQLKKQKWQADKSRSGHWHLVSPEGALMVFSSTPSDWRAVRNARSYVRKFGGRV